MTLTSIRLSERPYFFTPHSMHTDKGSMLEPLHTDSGHGHLISLWTMGQKQMCPILQTQKPEKLLYLREFALSVVLGALLAISHDACKPDQESGKA